ncbi:MAG: hypothetical protein SVU32_00940 [Candidatus Nanohaloarchaea archaeon]|nr:hypothetical protein [Candidatus Nanohaloarchaea archaeon]
MVSGDVFNLIEGVLSLFIFLTVWRTYQREGTASLNYFARHFAWFAVFQLIIGIRFFFSGMTPAKDVGFLIFGITFFAISLAYLPRVTFHIYRPEWEIQVFGLMLTAGAALTVYNLANWTMLGPGVAALTWVNMVLLLAVPFLYLGWKHAEQRWKMWFIAVGFLMKATAGTIISVMSGQTVLFVAEFLTFAGLALIFVGIYKDRAFSSPE